MGCAFRPGPRRCTTQCEIQSENHGGGGGRGCTGTGHRRQSKLHSPRQGRVMDARNKSPPTAANMSWVSGQTERPKDGKPAGRTEPSAIFDARRGIKSISGVRGAGRPTCERDCTHREKLCAICVGAEQRYTNGCRAVERGGTSKNSVVCRARQCAYVMRREPPCGQTASMHCSRVLSVVGCKSSVGNLCVFSCVTVRERAELFLN